MHPDRLSVDRQVALSHLQTHPSETKAIRRAWREQANHPVTSKRAISSLMRHAEVSLDDVLHCRMCKDPQVRERTLA